MSAYAPARALDMAAANVARTLTEALESDPEKWEAGQVRAWARAHPQFDESFLCVSWVYRSRVAACVYVGWHDVGMQVVSVF